MPASDGKSWPQAGWPVLPGDTLRAVLQEPGVRKNFADGGVTPMGLGPAEFSRFLQAEQNKFGAVVTKGRIKAE